MGEDHISSSHVPSKRIKLLKDDIPISDFMDKFQSQIYKYIKHSTSLGGKI